MAIQILKKLTAMLTKVFLRFCRARVFGFGFALPLRHGFAFGFCFCGLGGFRLILRQMLPLLLLPLLGVVSDGRIGKSHHLLVLILILSLPGMITDWGVGKSCRLVVWLLRQIHLPPILRIWTAR